MRILTVPGVLRPPTDTRLLAGVVRDRALAPGASVLEVFSGTGALAVSAALGGARTVTAIDISRRAALNTRLNASLNGVRVRALRGDLFEPVTGERFDLILANPPYLPSAEDRLPRRGPARAWDAGSDGRMLLDRLCAEAPEHLTAGGRILIVHSSISGERATFEALASAGLESSLHARERGPLGRLLSERADLLERRGLIAPGAREEDLLVVEGRRPAGTVAPDTLGLGISGYERGSEIEEIK